MNDRRHRSDLHYASAEGDVALAEALLAGGADPNVADAQDFTPLHFAAQAHDVSVVRLLVRAGAEIDAKNQVGNTPLGLAVFNSRGRGEVILRVSSPLSRPVPRAH